MFFKSKASSYLFWATLATAVVTVLIPYSPLGTTFELEPLVPLSFLLVIGLFVGVYMVLTEAVKRIFYRFQSNPAHTK